MLRQQFILALDGDLDVVESPERRDREAAATNTARAGEILRGARQSGRPAAGSSGSRNVARRVRVEIRSADHRALGAAFGGPRT
jgi:hypothetical protein